MILFQLGKGHLVQLVLLLRVFKLSELLAVFFELIELRVCVQLESDLCLVFTEVKLSVGSVVLEFADGADFELGGPIAAAGVASHLTREITFALITDIAYLYVVYFCDETNQFDAVSDYAVVWYVPDVLLLMIRLEVRQFLLDFPYHPQIARIKLHLDLYIEYCRYLSLSILDQQDAARLKDSF